MGMMRFALGAALVSALAACGGGGGGDSGAANGSSGAGATSYRLGGTATGLSGGAVSVSSNGQTITVPDGADQFAFPQNVANGAVYNLVIQSQTPGLLCSISHASGTINNADAYGAIISCDHAVGGSVAGLTSSGLQLADGDNTVDVAANASSFFFGNAKAAGSAYSIYVKTQPAAQTCVVAQGDGTMGSRPISDVAVTCTDTLHDSWALMSDPHDIGGIYTQRYGANVAVDAQGNAWVFGGNGDVSIFSYNTYNDVWRFDGKTWTQVMINFPEPAGNYTRPATRTEAVTWIDKQNHLWVFGGMESLGTNYAGYVVDNDMWRLDGTTWTRIVQPTTVSMGTQGVAAATNLPPARTRAQHWQDKAGNIWIYGGSNERGQPLEDLWKFDGTNWTWMGGSQDINTAPVYGQQGVADASNWPGGRYHASTWIDRAGNLCLYGGVQYGGYTAAMWCFNGTAWTWSGNSTYDTAPVYGQQGIAAASNNPGGRAGAATWRDRDGNIWLYGGARDINGEIQYQNDMWRFDGKLWTWVSGAQTPLQPSIQGALGQFSTGYTMGQRSAPTTWIDTSGRFWALGGITLYNHSFAEVETDLWAYQP
ncbi:Kelch repeat-containing protein [Amantichitinum ursilacus]|nr:kelch repeat-containing protein [Amantichitinum ursilacus]